MDAEDIVDEFEELLSRDLLLIMTTEKEYGLSEHEKLQKEKFVDRHTRLQEPTYAYYQRNNLMRTLGAKLLLPTRVSTLSKEEEKLRAHLTSST